MPEPLAEPPIHVVEAAIKFAADRACLKSARGAAIFEPYTGDLLALGRNAPVYGTCDGSPMCAAVCSKVCEHAEAAALREYNYDTTSLTDIDILHVKVVDGWLVTSGGPSCWQCSKMILADGRIRGVWLFREDGWTRYDRLDFHQRTLVACGIVMAK